MASATNQYGDFGRRRLVKTLLVVSDPFGVNAVRTTITSASSSLVTGYAQCGGTGRHGLSSLRANRLPGVLTTIRYLDPFEANAARTTPKLLRGNQSLPWVRIPYLRDQLRPKGAKQMKPCIAPRLNNLG